MAYALQIGRRAGASRMVVNATGAAAGGGMLALSALCVSCMAPVLSAVGLGLAGTLLAGVPKWLIACNALLLTGWGSLVLSRRLTACPLPPALLAGLAMAALALAAIAYELGRRRSRAS